jgi:hypothetical protein
MRLVTVQTDNLNLLVPGKEEEEVVVIAVVV